MEGSAEEVLGARTVVEVARAKWRGGRISPGDGEAVRWSWEEEERQRRVFQKAIFRFESSLELSVFEGPGWRAVRAVALFCIGAAVVFCIPVLGVTCFGAPTASEHARESLFLPHQCLSVFAFPE